MKNILIISLQYKEPYWMQTLDCIENTLYDVAFADRKGVGNMSEAFNRAFVEAEAHLHYEYVWFVTNIKFLPDVPTELRLALNRQKNLAAVHPSFKSDHLHIRPLKNYDRVLPVPFIEFTAPMVRTEIFKKIPLDEKMPYWGMDLDFSYRINQTGNVVGVHYGVTIDHTYLRFQSDKNKWTEERKQLRAAADQQTTDRLIEKYGKNWRTVLNYHG